MPYSLSKNQKMYYQKWYLEKEKKNSLSWAEFVPARLSVQASLKRTSWKSFVGQLGTATCALSTCVLVKFAWACEKRAISVHLWALDIVYAYVYNGRLSVQVASLISVPTTCWKRTGSLATRTRTLKRTRGRLSVLSESWKRADSIPMAYMKLLSTLCTLKRARDA